MSSTLKACSSLSGLVCVGPVQTLAWASSTVWFGFGKFKLRYEVEIAGLCTSDSESPNWSIVAQSSSAFAVKHIRFSLIHRPRSLTGNIKGVRTWKRRRSLLFWQREWCGWRKEDSGWKRAFMSISMFFPLAPNFVRLKNGAKGIKNAHPEFISKSFGRIGMLSFYNEIMNCIRGELERNISLTFQRLIFIDDFISLLFSN